MKASIAKVALLASLAAQSAATSCYDTSGTLHPGFLPCNSTLEVSTCCAINDQCLSNGLCFNEGASNVLSQQGCTDPNWGSPCHKFCPQALSYDEVTLVPCDQSWNGGGGGLGAVSYCCDPNAVDCCSMKSWFNVPVGTIIQNVVSTPTPTASLTTSLPISTSSHSTFTTATSILPTQAQNSTIAADAKRLRIGLGVGLGLGLPLSLAFIGLLGILVWEMRKSNQGRISGQSREMRDESQHDTITELESTARRHELSVSGK